MNVANANAFKGVSTKNKKSRLIPTLIGWNEWTMVYRPPPYQKSVRFFVGLYAYP